MKDERKPIIFLDIGSHKCQEIFALTSPAIYILILYIKRSILGFVFKQRLVPPIKDLISFLCDRRKIFKRFKFYFVVVEPNWRHFRNKIYRQVDNVFCLGIHDSDKTIQSLPFYYKSSEMLCQGATLFEHSVKHYRVEMVPVIDADHFFRYVFDPYMRKFDFDSGTGLVQLRAPQVLLRVNCEGAEDDVLYAAQDVLGARLKGVLGSLDDVLKKKGEDAATVLEGFIEESQLGFCRFSSNMASWPSAIKYIGAKLD